MNNGFNDWCERINKMISKGLALLFTALIISQLLLMNQTVKTFISRTDKLEGKAIADSQLFIIKGEIEISIENDSSLRPLVFYINGDKVASPAGKSIRLQVKDSDIIEVSGAKYNDIAILRVTTVSENITVPELGKLIYVNNNLVMIDRVRLK
ncbi:MAG: hypothetical protein ACYCYE_01740 [Clostridia bacterium]